MWYIKESGMGAHGNGGTLGARGHLPSGYMVGSLWVLKQFAHPIFTGYRVNTFEKSSAQCPVGTL